MDEPSQPEEQPTTARRIAYKVMRIVAYMVSFVLLVWVVAVLRSPSETQFEQDEMSRKDARKKVQDRKQPSRVMIPAAISNNSTDINASIPRPLDANTTFEYQPVGFAAGERAEYTLKFAKASIGTGMFHVAPRTPSSGAPWQFSLRLKAMGGTFAYDANATINADFTRTLSYQNTEKMPFKDSRTVRLVYDDANRTVRRSLNGEPPSGPIDLPDRYFDPLSMIYAFREMDFNAGQTVKWAVTDGKSKYAMSASVKRREEIQIGTQTFRTFLVEPDLGNFRGVFNQGKDAQLQIWFSDDAYTLPLRLRFKSPIGEITADNKDYNRPAPPRTR